MEINEFPSIVELMDRGVQKEINEESRLWNTREWKGTEVDRFPLSPSQIGKCSLALARNLAHYLGLADYNRSDTHLAPRIKRVFARGHLLESALIDDMEKYAGFKVVDRQKRLTLFPLSEEHSVEGSIDGIAVSPRGVRVLVDFKSKGAFYSANFTDSIGQFFAELKQTGFVESLTENTFFINEVKGLFDVISMDDFFVDYLLQLNAYGSAEKVDFVALYYENKNTCANYEVRWVPHPELFEYAKNKFQHIYDTVINEGAEAVPKDFSLGSSRCKLCDFREQCWGKYEPKGPYGRRSGTIPSGLDLGFIASQQAQVRHERIEEDILKIMSEEDLTHIQLSNGTIFERKFLKSPKPHYELRLSK